MSWTDTATRQLRGSISYHFDQPIIWDGGLHEISVPQGKGWYIAFPDRSGALYCLPLRGHEIKVWVPRWEGSNPDEATLAKWASEAQELEEESEELREATERVQTLWKQAVPAEHPDLASHGLDNVPDPSHGLRVVSEATQVEDLDIPAGTLLVPMYREGKLANVQLNFPGGRELFLPGAQVWGCGLVVGGGFDPELIYVCHDFPTAWTINEATGCPVVAALMVGGLRPLAEAVRKEWPEAEIVIASDNDRWGDAMHGTRRSDDRIRNPSLHFAQQAARACGGEVAVPDFEVLEGRPTSFADLGRLEGLDRVRAWLDPDAASAAIVFEGKDEEGPAEWVDDAPFRCLGHDGGSYFYQLRETGELVHLKMAAHTPKNLLRIHPDTEWWKKHFGERERGPRGRGLGTWGSCTTPAIAALVKESHRRGLFVEAERIRGRGVWRGEDGEVAWHLGDRILTSKRVKIPEFRRFISPGEYGEGDWIYPLLTALPAPDTEQPMTLKESRVLLRLFQESFPWTHEVAGKLLAGCAVLAPIASSLPARPHLWIGGHSRSDRESIMTLVGHLLDKGCHPMEGVSADRMRKVLRDDALPVLYTVPGERGKRPEDKIRAVLGLARDRTRDSAPTFLIASHDHFCDSLREEAEAPRVAIVRLRSEDAKGARAVANDRLASYDAFTSETGRRLSGRTFLWLADGRLDELLNLSRAVVGDILADAWSGDLYGALLAGAWTLRADHMPDESELRDWIEAMGIEHFVSMAPDAVEAQAKGRRILSVLLDTSVTVTTASGPETATIGELVAIAAAICAPHAAINSEEADTHLRRLGLRVRFGDLHLANQSEWIELQLRGIAFENWIESVRTLDKVRAGGVPMRFSGKLSRTTAIPLDILPIKRAERSPGRARTG